MSRRAARIRTLAVTGGTGFVGQHLLRMALAEGYDVRALTRGWKPPEDEIVWVDGALDRPDSLAKLVQGADAVIHIAGLISGDAAAFEAVNVTGTAAHSRPPPQAGQRPLDPISARDRGEAPLFADGRSQGRARGRGAAPRVG